MNAALGVDDDRPSAPAVTHLLWFCDGLLLFFLISWVGTSLVRLDNDYYYAVFIWSALTFLSFYVRATNSPVLHRLRERWRESLFAGVLVSLYLVVAVWNANPTEGPSGLLLVFEVAWRGIAYGVADALVLTAFPLSVAVGVIGELPTRDRLRRVGVGALTLALVWLMSMTYHLGFEQFDRSDVDTPQRATLVVSIPTVVTLNPLGSVLAQTAFHVAVTVRTFESDTLVPPEVEFVPDYEPPGVFGPR